MELIQYQDLPSLDQLTHLDEGKRIDFVLHCVQLALPSEKQLDWHRIHSDYKLCFCLLKLWWNTKTEHLKLSQTTLLAIIISFLKHALLDTYDEINGKYTFINIEKQHVFPIHISERTPTTDTLPEKPLRQYSHNELKSYFSRKECFDLRESIRRYATIPISNDEIEEELQECQQFHKELSMINQFIGQPLVMHPPHFYFSDFTYPLALHLNQSNHFWKDIQHFSLNNQILFLFIKELFQFIVTTSSLTTEDN